MYSIVITQMTDNKTLKTKPGFFVNNNLGTIVNKKQNVSNEAVCKLGEPSSLDIYKILSSRDVLYRTIALNPSSMYFFTVTPKGTGKCHADYLQAFKDDLWNIKALDYAYFIKEFDNTDHLHGVIRVKGLHYKFMKMVSDKYVFRVSRLDSLKKVASYMSKHNPTVMYYLASQWYSTSVNDWLSSPKKQSKRFKEIKLI